MSTAALLAAEKPGWPKDIPLLPHPAELIIGAIAFAIMYWIYAKKVVPRMEQMYAERTAAIEGGMEQAQQAQDEAAAAKAEYDAKLQGANSEAGQIREDARAQGAQIVADARAQANEEAARITESAQKAIAAERQQAAVQLRGDVGRMSTDLAGRIVGESLEDETRRRGIVERFLAEIESGDVTPEKVDVTVTETEQPNGGATRGATRLGDA